MNRGDQHKGNCKSSIKSFPDKLCQNSRANLKRQTDTKNLSMAFSSLVSYIYEGWWKVHNWPRYSHGMWANEIYFSTLSTHFLTLVLQYLDPIGQKGHQQQIWHHHSNCSANEHTTYPSHTHIYIYIYVCVCVCAHTNTHTQSYIYIN